MACINYENFADSIFDCCYEILKLNKNFILYDELLKELIKRVSSQWDLEPDEIEEHIIDWLKECYEAGYVSFIGKDPCILRGEWIGLDPV